MEELKKRVRKDRKPHWRDVDIHLSALRVRDLQRFVDSFLIHVRTVDLLPEHLRIRLHLTLRPLNETYECIYALVSPVTRDQSTEENLQLATSFSL